MESTRILLTKGVKEMAKILAAVLAIIVASSAAHATSVYIDSGSPNPITAADGTLYSADTSSSGADFYDYGMYANRCSNGSGSTSIAGTQNPRIYQTVRYGPSLSYSVPVPNGCYDVFLHLVECSYGEPGHRLSKVMLNGSTLINGLDVFAEVGAARNDTKRFSSIGITGGTANLTFSSNVTGENVVISAIDIVPGSGCTTPLPPAPIKHIFVVVLENANAQDAQAQPFMGSLLSQGAYLNNYHGVAHPSQPNYIAMAAGSTLGVVNDNSINLSARHLGDLLEAKGKNWKVYAEEYPGNCYTGDASGSYVRKHNPFISFQNIQNNLTRCNAHIVNSSSLGADIANKQLPEFSLYVPGLQNDGHDTGVAFADQWLSETFGGRLQDPNFIDGTLFVVTFDENDPSNDIGNNLIYTLLFGSNAIAGASSQQQYNHYSLLRLIEDTFSLGNLGRNDATAQPINDTWN
jgi:Phosphoesterase family/Malectin domain